MPPLCQQSKILVYLTVSLPCLLQHLHPWIQPITYMVKNTMKSTGCNSAREENATNVKWVQRDSFCDVMPVLKLAHVDISHNVIVMSALSVLFILSPSPHSVLLCAYSGDHPENPFSHWQKQSFLHLLLSYPGCFSLLWYCLVHLPPAEGCTHSRNRQSNCTHVHSGHACSESSYLHLEEQGSEGSLLEHSQTNDLNPFITKLFRNPCICHKYFLDIFLLQISGFQNKHDILEER